MIAVPITKLFAWGGAKGGGNNGGHVLRETASRGLCGLVCPSWRRSVCVCVFYYCRTCYNAVRVGGGGEWRTCYVCVYYCRT